MNYYLFALLGKKLSLLTYSSEKPIVIGQELIVPLKSQELVAVCMHEVEKPSYTALHVNKFRDYYYTQEQRDLATFIANYYMCTLSESLVLFKPFSTKIQSINDTKVDTKTLALSEEQENALAFLNAHRASLLFGDTGSGKTEIYMARFKEVLEVSKRILFLLPEIGLTPQMKIRLEKQFGNEVVFWHSKLTKKAKEKNLDLIRTGKAKIIAGTRSALFLPIENLGLIVIDEEHDDSYKASSSPRYHARDIALYYAKMLDIPIVLGSATPSLSSYKNIKHYRLRGSHYKAKKSYTYEMSFDFISPQMMQLLEANSSNKKQSICFVPTRANFKYLTCNRCGYAYECPFCSVAMSYHKKSNAYKCHYCNYTEPFTTTCPKCRVGHLEFNRMGTSEVLDLLSHQLPDASIAKFDRDEVSTEKKLKLLLKRFNDNEIDILVGTQMLSKGHDYHDVSLAIVFGIDTFLHVSDYRAREKALSLLIQIAGRSGRKESATVMIQTFNKDFFSKYIEDYELFLKEELELRKQLYPPFKRLARVLFSHVKREKALEHMNLMVVDLQRYSEIEVVGFGPSQIEKIANKYRFHILLRSDKATNILRVLNVVKSPHAQIDMDPIDFN